MIEHVWIRKYTPTWPLTNTDCYIIGSVFKRIYKKVSEEVVQGTDSARGGWEYQAPYSVWVVKDDHGRCVRGEKGQSKDTVIFYYLTQTLNELCRRLFLLRSVRTVAWQAVTLLAADLRVGKSKCAGLGGPRRNEDGEIVILRCVYCAGFGDHETLYDCGGILLCGDCRYLLRHGRPAPHKPKRQVDGFRIPEDEYRETTHTINRWRPTEIVSRTHYRVLMEIERAEMAQASDFDNQQIADGD